MREQPKIADVNPHGKVHVTAPAQGAPPSDPHGIDFDGAGRPVRWHWYGLTSAEADRLLGRLHGQAGLW